MIYFENLQLTICLVLFFIIGKFLFIYTLVQPVSSIRIPPDTHCISSFSNYTVVKELRSELFCHLPVQVN
jgi:hypothetical protein